MKKPYLIAEIGGNHQGNFDTAVEMLELALDTDVDAVKFQIYYADSLVNPKFDQDRHEHFKKFELSIAQHLELHKICSSRGKDYLASIWDREAFDSFKDKMPFIKIGSGDMTSYEFLKLAVNSKKPIVLSTGLAKYSEIESSVKYIRSLDSYYNSSKNLTLLQCTSMYPIPDSDANLSVMNTLKSRLDVSIGYSDHTIGMSALEVATALGATILEFHFTNNKDNTTFRDHKVSLDKIDTQLLCKKLDLITELVGSSVKVPTKTEIKSDHRVSFRRSIYAKKNIQKNEVITESHLTSLRPAINNESIKYDLLIGRKASCNIEKNDPVLVSKTI
jgi:N,N'-diacetyllegionaminate synthase